MEWLGVDAVDVLDIAVLPPDSAVVRFGPKARGGAVLIVTKPDSVSRTPPAAR